MSYIPETTSGAADFVDYDAPFNEQMAAARGAAARGDAGGAMDVLEQIKDAKYPLHATTYLSILITAHETSAQSYRDSASLSLTLLLSSFAPEAVSEYVAGSVHQAELHEALAADLRAVLAWQQPPTA